MMSITAGNHNACIYQIRNLANGRVYVGSAVDFSVRKKGHLSKLRRGLHHSQKLQNAFNKYGESSFVFEVIEVLSDKSMLVSIEQGYIERLNAVKNGYNICSVAGSTLGIKLREETKRKMSASQMLIPKEQRMARSAKLINLSKLPKTEEWKDKISKAHIGKVVSDEARKAMKIAALKVSDESKAKRAEALRQSDIARGGRHSVESKAKISSALSGRKLSESHRAAIKAAWAKRKSKEI